MKDDIPGFSLDVLSLLNEASDTRDLLRRLTGVLQKWTRCEAVGVRLREGDDFPYFETRGFPAEFVQLENSLCARDLNGQMCRDSAGMAVLDCMCGNVICGRFDPAKPFFTARGSFFSNGTTELLATTTDADRQTRTRNRCNGEGYESVALIRLRAGQETFGLLQINDRAKGRFTPPLLAFLEHTADQVALAIAERKMREALHTSEALYRSLFQSMLNGFAYCRMVYDGDRPEDFVYLAVNDAFRIQTGLKNVIGKRVSEVIPGFRESSRPLLETYSRVARTGKPERFEVFVEPLAMWFDIAVHCPQPDHFVAVFDVITERKRTEQALAAGRNFLRTLIDSVPDVIFTKDVTGRFTMGNTAALSLVGATSEAEIIGRTVFDFYPEPLAQAYHRDDLRVISGAQSLINRQEPCVDRKGHERWHLTTKVPLRDPAGKVVGLLGISRNMTEQRRLQEEKTRIEAELQQAQKMESVGRLAGGVAHDFNNMLQAILGNTELALSEVAPGTTLDESLREIKAAAERSADLTRNLLAFARKQTIRPQVLDLNRTVTGMLAMLQRLIGENIELAWTPGLDLWPVRIDPSQVDQILANLLVNARDAIAGFGRVTIDTANVTLDTATCAGHTGFIPGDHVRLTVSDTGCGMDRDTLAHLFEPFFTTKQPGAGTGLGLATVYGIVKQNGAFIDVRSAPGAGSTFTLYLPRTDANALEPPAATASMSPPGGAETVLLVEDDAAILNQTRKSLHRMGYTVLAAGLPREALRCAADYPGTIHLLITDVVMPEMNGRQLAEQLVASRPDMRCLFMSGYTADVIAPRGTLDPGVHFIAKPFTLQALASKIRQILAARAAG